jgi:integrase
MLNNATTIVNAMVIRERRGGKLEGRITIKGKRKSLYGDTKTEVKNKAKEYLSKVENGYSDPKKIILNEYIEYWLATYKWNKIEPSSYTRLYRVYECQIEPTIGKKWIGSIETKDIQNLIDEYANPPKGSELKPLARSGLKKILHLLNPCLKKAVKEGIISKNPCEDVVIPVESCIQTETRVQDTLNDDEIIKLKTAALTKYPTSQEYIARNSLILLIMLNLGLRVGEMQALEWNDFNLKDKTVTINKTVQNNIKNFSNDGGNATYDRLKRSAKTQAGMRVIPLNDSIIWYLNELKEYDKRNGISSKLVCCTGKGTLMISRNLARSLDRITAKTDINKRVTLHTLRHTFGSTLLRKGVPIEVVSKLMGHANVTITYNKYIHVIQEQKAKAMELVCVC